MLENILVYIHVYIYIFYHETGRQQQPQTTINVSTVGFRPKLMKDIGHFTKKYIYCPSGQAQC